LIAPAVPFSVETADRLSPSPESGHS
jgi:hypothetical protein